MFVIVHHVKNPRDWLVGNEENFPLTLSSACNRGFFIFERDSSAIYNEAIGSQKRKKLGFSSKISNKAALHLTLLWLYSSVRVTGAGPVLSTLHWRARGRTAWKRALFCVPAVLLNPVRGF